MHESMKTVDQKPPLELSDAKTVQYNIEDNTGMIQVPSKTKNSSKHMAAKYILKILSCKSSKKD